MVRFFVVRVPEHRMVTPASFLMVVIWVTIALDRTHHICYARHVRHIFRVYHIHRLSFDPCQGLQPSQHETDDI